MEQLKLVSQALDKATKSGCFNLDECALIIKAVQELSEALQAKETQADGKSE